MGSRNCTLVLKLVEGTKDMGKVVIRAEPIAGGNEVYDLSFEGHNMRKTICCIPEDAFFTIYKKMTRHNQSGGQEEKEKLINNGSSEEWLKIYESPKGSNNCIIFPTATLSSSKLYSGNPNTQLKVSLLY